MVIKGKCCYFFLMNVIQNSLYNFFMLVGYFNVVCKFDELKRRGGGGCLKKKFYNFFILIYYIV